MNRRNVARSRRSRNTRARRARQSSRRWPLVTIVLVGIVLVGLVTYQQVPSALAGLITIQQVTVSGLDHVPRRELSTLLALSTDATLLSVDAEELQRRVEVHPWIAEVTVGRLLPHTLTVIVRERQPAALFKHAGGKLVLDKEGIVLSIASDDAFPLLPVLSGINVVTLLEGNLAQRERIRKGIQAAQLVGEHLGSDLRVMLDHPQYVEVVTEKMIFRFSQDLDTSWQRYVTLKPMIQAGLSGKRQEIDLRFAGKVIVR
ncbi:MAG: FtsQ-type POTRA domain-containing protein [Nitrospirota bacterium]|nr:FtsQ-type POTRA domain-containing protein [Nitrospirota bacterium]